MVSMMERKVSPVPPEQEAAGSFRAAEHMMQRAAMCESTVLLSGETGTGKEVAARAIHELSRRAGGPFVPVDCPSLTETLAESQLFGHVRGAFTGATQDALGFFRAADHGTLFLDEVAELPAALQPKLLRCLQERCVVPVGTSRAVSVDVRIVAATHRELREMVRAGGFREDLFFRLNVLHIWLPPLRHRPDEIVPIARLLVKQAAELNGQPPKELSAGALECMLRHSWPGNIRELANAIEHAFVMAHGPCIDVCDLPPTVRAASLEERQPVGPSRIPTLAEAERALVLRALERTGGQKSRAAEMLGVSRQGLYRLILRHRLKGTSQHRSFAAGDAFVRPELRGSDRVSRNRTCVRIRDTSAVAL